MKTFAAIATVACVFALASPAPAQDRYDQNSSFESYDAQTSGTIDSFRVISIPGYQDDHVIVRVSPTGAERNHYTFVDLGSRRDLQQSGIRVYADQSISATGRMGQLDGRPILFAEHISLDGQRIALGQASEMQHQQEGTYRSEDDYDRVWPYEDSPEPYSTQEPYMQSENRYVVRGEVESVREFSVDGMEDDHTLVRITDASDLNRTWIVDLGPSSGPLAELDLEEGDRVLIQGHRAQIEGRPVVRAVHVAEVFSNDDEFARGDNLSNRLRRDSPEPDDSPSTRTGKPQLHDLPSRTSSHLDQVDE